MTVARQTAWDLVADRVDDLQKRYTSKTYQDPAAVAALARLRRGVGKAPHAVVDLLEYTLLDPPPKQDEPTPEEWAVHVAMTLFAMHQQSRAEKMHCSDIGLGAALRAPSARAGGPLPDPLVRRFRMLLSADSFTELTYHLRGAVQLLRTEHSPLDYGLLTRQLVAWQRFGPDRVQLRWGREFYQARRATDNAPDPASD